jgi:single-strand DNA-binding protein
MSDVNNVTFSGRLTRNPELRTTPSGVSVTDLNVASNRYGKDRQQYTTYFRLTVWNQQAEWANERLGTGDLIFVQGQLVDDNFEKNGVMTSGRLKVDNARVQLVTKKTTNEDNAEQSDLSDVPPEV